MNALDPRIETILSYTRRLWSILPEFIKSFVWFSLKVIYRIFFFRSRAVKTSEENEVPSEKKEEKQNRVIAKAPTRKQWDDLLLKYKETKKQRLNPKDIVDIIVPIYDGYDETMRCIYSVLNSKTSYEYELVLINDKSPNMRLSEEIKKLSCDFDCINLIVNETNLGFVKSTNKGMRLHNDRDVIWLNSDTEVFDFWLDRIISVAYQRKEIATVTPISNNATICSYPIENIDNFSPLEISDSDLDKLACEVNKGTYVEAPTGVGFCMFIKREALTENGLLDEQAFGKGYGEENDLCQRFKEKGWMNVITPSVFVRHYGATSFKSESLQRQQDAYQTVLQLHPEYGSQIEVWSRLSPLSKHRLRLDVMRYLIAKNIKLEAFDKIILIVTHNLGGGTETFVKTLCKRIRDEGSLFFIIRPNSEGNPVLDCDGWFFPNLSGLDIKYDSELLRDLCKLLRITNIHINHTFGYNENFIDALVDINIKEEIPIAYTLHDYFVFCPLCNLYGKKGTACLSIDVNRCDICSKRMGIFPARKQRGIYQKLLSVASSISVPSLDAKQRVLSVYPNLKIDVVPHEENIDHLIPICDTKLYEKHLRLGFIGAISEAKGSLFIKNFAEFLSLNQLNNDVTLSVLGYTDRDDEIKIVDVEILGKYKNEQEVREWIVEKEINALMIPSIWPETYCYTLSIALRTGLPVFTFDIGAQKERMIANGRSDFIIPIQKANDFGYIVNFINQRRKCCKAFPKVSAHNVATSNYYK